LRRGYRRFRLSALPAAAVLVALLAFGPAVAAQSPSPAAGRLCLVTIDELNALTGLSFVSMAAGDSNCTYDSDPAADLYTIDIRIQPPDPTALEIPEDSLIVTRMGYSNGRDITVGGFPAWLSPEGVWVDIGLDVLAIQPILLFATDPPAAETFLPQVAELALSRLPLDPSAVPVDQPESGALARIVNLYADEAGPQELDIYGYRGSREVIVGSVGYGAVSDWFDPGLTDGSGGDRTATVAVHRAGDPSQLARISQSPIDAGVRLTVVVQPPGTFGVGMRAAYDQPPETGGALVPQAIADKAVLVTSYEGLPEADFEGEVFLASVGNFCLPGRYTDPEIEEIVGHPLGQPIGSELVVEPGSHSLTIHRDDSASGEISACDNEPVAQVPLQVAAGDRAYVFLYATPTERQINLLVVPFDG
jgi:hypothetical protein